MDNDDLDNVYVEIEVEEEKLQPILDPIVEKYVKDFTWEDLQKKTEMMKQQYTQDQLLKVGIPPYEVTGIDVGGSTFIYPDTRPRKLKGVIEYRAQQEINAQQEYYKKLQERQEEMNREYYAKYVQGM